MLAAGALLSGRGWGLPLIVVGLLLALIGLSIGVHAHGWVTVLDGPVASWINHRLQQSHRLRPAAEAVAHLGNPAAVAMAAVVSGALLSTHYRSLIPGLVVVFATGTAVLAKDIMKVLIERPVTEAEFAASPVLSSNPHPFPSGHVAGIATLLGIVAAGIGVRGGAALRLLLASCVFAGTSIVAVSRLVLEAHWFSDAVGGVLLEGIVVTIGTGALWGASRAGQRQARVHRNAPQKGRLRT